MLPAWQRQVDGPEIGRGIFKFEGDSESRVLKFADVHYLASDFGPRSTVDERHLLAFGKHHTGLKYAAMGIHRHGKGIRTDHRSVVSANFQQHLDLQQHALTAAPRGGIGLWVQCSASPLSVNLTFRAMGFS